MVAIGKSLRWFFGINGVLFFVIWVRFAWACPQVLWKVFNLSASSLPTFLGVPTAIAIVIAGFIGYGGLALIFSMTWWTLGNAKPSARG
jgi:hypothetical protein